jgi:uncharacterized protein YqjF (DUF2071 family)
MHHKWRNLLFLHWTYDPAEVQSTLPEGLFVDTYDNYAYIGVVPFFMMSVRPRFLPALPWLSDFMELNLRTYVYDRNGTPGVWFYSLDASQWLAVRLARLFFSLPYYHARMDSTTKESSGEVYFSSWRHKSDLELRSKFHYRRSGSVYHPDPKSLEFFLVERYVLFTRRRDSIFSGRVHHQPYPIQKAELLQWDDHLFVLNGINNPGRAPDHIMMSDGVDVDVYFIEQQ